MSESQVNIKSIYGDFSKKLGIKLPIDLANLLLNIYPQGPKSSLFRKDICNPMFIAALLTLDQVWKQPMSKNR